MIRLRPDSEDKLFTGQRVERTHDLSILSLFMHNVSTKNL
jgi:hypothetical protein